MKTDEQMRDLARDILTNRVFTDRHCHAMEDLPMCFLPLALGGADKLPADVGMIYEYMTKAGPGSCNGMPTFLSLNFLTKEETERVLAFWREMKEAIA